MTTFNPDGPHSPEQTIAAAEQVADLIRYLVYAARAGQDGLKTPEDAYALAAALRTAAERFPQLSAQVCAHIDAWQSSGRLADADGGNADQRAEETRFFLANAGNRAGEMASALRGAQNAMAGLKLTEDDDA